MFKTMFTADASYVVYAATNELAETFPATSEGQKAAEDYVASHNAPRPALTATEAAFLARGTNPVDDPEKGI